MMDVIIDFRHDVSELESCRNGSSSSYIESAELSSVKDGDNFENANTSVGPNWRVSVLEHKLEMNNIKISDLKRKLKDLANGS